LAGLNCRGDGLGASMDDHETNAYRSISCNAFFQIKNYDTPDYPNTCNLIISPLQEFMKSIIRQKTS